MSEATDRDRERAEGLLTDDIAVGWDGSGWHEARNAIAQALADERERARRPLLALAATTVATVGALTGHTTGCNCERCDHLRLVGLCDEVERLSALAADAHMRGFEVGREWRP